MKLTFATQKCHVFDSGTVPDENSCERSYNMNIDLGVGLEWNTVTYIPIRNWLKCGLVRMVFDFILTSGCVVRITINLAIHNS